jgi:hypothetical protein
MGAYPFFQTDFVGPTIEVAAPVTGESLAGGSSYNITWTATDETGITDNSLSIYYSTNGGTSYPNLITQDASSVSPYSWSVPLLNSDQIRLRVQLTDNAPANSLGTGESYGNFTIDTTIPIVTVEAPAGGEVWGGGSTHPISWEATDNLGFAANPISIYFTSNEGTSWSLIASGEANDGIYPSWAVPVINSSQCRISVEALDNTSQEGSSTSASSFTIDSLAPTVNITAPDGGEYISAESTYSIQYTATDTVGLASNPIDIYYTTDEAVWTTIASDQSNSGSYSWTVPDIGASTTKVSVEAEDQGGNIGKDISAGNFTIDNSSPEVTFTDLVGGENITGEGTYTINYNVTDEAGIKPNSINIYYSTDGGTTWITIATGEANTGSYDWTVPNVSSTTTKIRIEAEDLSGNKKVQESAEFSLTATTPPDNTAPWISIQINNVALKDGDYIPKQPRINVLITDEGYPWEAQIYVDGAAISTRLNQVSATSLAAYAQVEAELEGENVTTHSISVEARDYAGNRSTEEVTGLKVSYSAVRMEEAPVTSQPVFQPAEDGEATISIAYSLTQDIDTTIYMVGLSGEIVWTRKFVSGDMGGKAGYNVVEFNGVSDISGAPLGNGIYVYQVVAEGRMLGKGHIVIYE